MANEFNFTFSVHGSGEVAPDATRQDDTQARRIRAACKELVEVFRQQGYKVYMAMLYGGHVACDVLEEIQPKTIEQRVADGEIQMHICSAGVEIERRRVVTVVINGKQTEIMTPATYKEIVRWSGMTGQPNIAFAGGEIPSTLIVDGKVIKPGKGVEIASNFRYRKAEKIGEGVLEPNEVINASDGTIFTVRHGAV